MINEQPQRHFLSRDFGYLALLLEGILAELRYMRGLDPDDASFNDRREAEFAMSMEEILRHRQAIYGPPAAPITPSASVSSKAESPKRSSEPEVPVPA